MENGDNNVTQADVIDKLKDDGDFDKLRLQIIQKLKENVTFNFFTSEKLGFMLMKYNCVIFDCLC